MWTLLADVFSSGQGFLILVLRDPWISGLRGFPEIVQNSVCTCVCVCRRSVYLGRSTPLLTFSSPQTSNTCSSLFTFTCCEKRRDRKRIFPTLTTHLPPSCFGARWSVGCGEEGASIWEAAGGAGPQGEPVAVRTRKWRVLRETSRMQRDAEDDGLRVLGAQQKSSGVGRGGREMKSVKAGAGPARWGSRW